MRGSAYVDAEQPFSAGGLPGCLGECCEVAACNSLLNPPSDRRTEASERVDYARKRRHAKVDRSDAVPADRERDLSFLGVAGKVP